MYIVPGVFYGVGAGVYSSRCVLWPQKVRHISKFFVFLSQWLIGCDAPYAQPGAGVESWLVRCVADRAPARPYSTLGRV
ncbi:hypothetical protein [Arthrospira platensis]|uniref:hypothetical protein n=1 Tax=Limnospira TaxID=2596745 RepID=UPI000ACB1514|nr:hypothetical protein [Arthrospira platensis]MDT9185784.1 hypothetical protein [Limnospira sp. PMC 289.06]